MTDKNFYSIPEIAKMLGISRIAVYKKVKKGEIAATKIGRNFAVHKTEFASILGSALTPKQKQVIEAGVNKAVSEYGETLKLLGNA